MKTFQWILTTLFLSAVIIGTLSYLHLRNFSALPKEMLANHKFSMRYVPNIGSEASTRNSESDNHQEIQLPTQAEEANNPFSYLRSSPISKDIVVHSAIFDSRSRNNHKNVTMILIGANRTIYDAKWITGCGVGTKYAKDYLIRLIEEDKLMHVRLQGNWPLYEQLVVECYDIFGTNGSRAFITYKTSETSRTFVVESEMPYMIPAPKVKNSGKYNFTVVVCTKAHTRGITFLPEFIRYQKTLGVDHVHVTVADTFIKDGGFRDRLMTNTFALEAIKSGFLTIRIWKDWYNGKENYERSTILQYHDCMYRFRGTYDYVFNLDSDDFFNPRIAGLTLKDVIVKFCYVRPVASCAFRWLFYYPEICGFKSKVGPDGNVTNHLNPHRAKDAQGRLKSVHSMAALVDASFHDAKCKTCLLPGYKVADVPANVAYVAHNRMYAGNMHIPGCKRHH